MKMDKTKAIISTLAVALVITTSLAILNVTRINNDKKKGAAADMQSEQTLTQTLTKESTTQENIEETTAEPKKAVAKAPQKSAETTQTTAPTEDIIIPQNQTIEDTRGNVVRFKEVKIRKDEFILVTFNREKATGIFFNIDGYDMTYTDNNGKTMGKPDGYGTKYGASEATSAMLAYDPDITSITVSYTFPDGTNASAVLNLK